MLRMYYGEESAIIQSQLFDGLQPGDRIMVSDGKGDPIAVQVTDVWKHGDTPCIRVVKYNNPLWKLLPWAVATMLWVVILTALLK